MWRWRHIESIVSHGTSGLIIGCVLWEESHLYNQSLNFNYSRDSYKSPLRNLSLQKSKCIFQILYFPYNELHWGNGIHSLTIMLFGTLLCTTDYCNKNTHTVFEWLELSNCNREVVGIKSKCGRAIFHSQYGSDSSSQGCNNTLKR